MFLYTRSDQLNVLQGHDALQANVYPDLSGPRRRQLEGSEGSKATGIACSCLCLMATVALVLNHLCQLGYNLGF